MEKVLSSYSVLCISQFKDVRCKNTPCPQTRLRWTSCWTSSIDIFLKEWICYLGEKIRWTRRWKFVLFFIWFGLVCIPFTDILIRTLSTKGKYFETWLLNKCHTLIFLEFVSTANSPHGFYASHTEDVFGELNLQTSLYIYRSLQITSFPLHLHNCLNSHFSDFFVQITAMTLDRSLGPLHSTCT